MGPHELVLAINAARKYFVEDRTKVQIAADLGISRYKVARLLDSARAEGIVRIEISTPTLVNPGLSERLRRKLGLARCLVVDLPGTGDIDSARHAIGAAAAGLLAETVTAEDTLGIAWGRSVASMASALTTLARCDVVQLTGVAGDLTHTPVDILRRVAAISGGDAFPIFAPLIVPDPATASALRSHPGVARTIEQFSRVTTATIAVGNWSRDGSQLYASLPPTVIGKLKGAPIVGEVCGLLLDDAGRQVPTQLDNRTIAIGYDELRAIPDVIAVAAGAAKARAIYAVTRSGIATSLVTDTSAATTLLTA